MCLYRFLENLKLYPYGISLINHFFLNNRENYTNQSSKVEISVYFQNMFVTEGI